MQIKTQQTKQSRLPQLDFDNIPFGRVFSDHMFVVDFIDGSWQDARIVPYGEMQLEPTNMALHYGQSVFEGMKATKFHDGRPMLMTPEKHARRLNASARRLAMAEIPEELFLAGLKQLVEMDQAWIPPTEGSALYIRPFMFAMDNSIGVRPSDRYRFMILTCPVGPYYAKPVKLWAETSYVRAAVGGVGEAKAAGNYAAALLPAQKAQERGYDQILWLDAKNFEYVQEVGTMNIFFVIDGKIVTPAADGAILHGITRDSIIELLRTQGKEVEVRPVRIQEIVDASRAGTLEEIFGSGTAAVISFVESIHYKGEDIELPKVANWSVAPGIKAHIEGLRSGRIADELGWFVEAKSDALAPAF